MYVLARRPFSVPPRHQRVQTFGNQCAVKPQLFQVVNLKENVQSCITLPRSEVLSYEILRRSVL